MKNNKDIALVTQLARVLDCLSGGCGFAEINTLAMNYERHYTTLVNRAKNRSLTTYTERHHVVPQCLGGSDDKSNLVDLTPEEHYVAHQLLVKMHPREPKLVYALNMMTQGRPDNKRYGWVRRRYQHECKKRVGSSNPSYGKSWYHNPETTECGRFVPGTEPQGWVPGRILKEKRKTCNICDRDIGIDNARNNKKYCSKSCREYKMRKESEYWFNLYQYSGLSIRKFVEEYNCNHSFDALSKMFRKHIPEHRTKPW